MPPKTRGRVTKPSKENIENSGKIILKPIIVPKPARKALADKTNSASDDNTSVEVPVKLKKTLTAKIVTEVGGVRPRRERRLPSRFVENQVLNGLSNSKEELITPKHKASESAPSKNDETNSSPFKTPSKVENSLVANRPRRICRLPSRFEEHSMSPSKFIPVQPCHASTPKAQNSSKFNSHTKNKCSEKKTTLKEPVKPVIKKPLEKKVDKPIDKTSPDSNNNPKKSKRLQAKKVVEDPSPTKNGYDSTQDITPQSPIPKRNNRRPVKAIEVDDSYKLPSKKVTLKTKKVASPKKTQPKDTAKVTVQKLVKNSSFRVLEEKKQSSSKEDKNLDIYEFTFDPNEEPAPQKKKRKVVRKKPTKPKTVVFKSNYDQNVSKALTALKKTLQTETVKTLSKTTNQVNTVASNNKVVKDPTPTIEINKETPHIPEKSLISAHVNLHVPEKSPLNLAHANQHVAEIFNTNPNQTPVYSNNHVSIQVEDIAADFESINHNHDVLNYSPVNSPHPITPNPDVGAEKSIHTKDPLNLQGDFSFFDDQPVASSSMNVSTRHPLASPWRVEFGSLPIKWQANTYVKANMTPAVESSFINIYDNKKKHVYTNLVPEPNEVLPEIVDNSKNLKQTSIISFIKEVAERSASKKKRGRSVTPTKVNSLFENLPETIATDNDRTPKKAKKNKSKTPNSSTENMSTENKNPNASDPNEKIAKQKEKDHTFFGFDESVNQDDQENVSPIKVAPQVRALRPRSRAVLQEINAMTGPTRAAVPGKGKIASSEVVNQVYEQLKSATDAPLFPDKDVNVDASNEVTNVENTNDPSWNQDLDDDDASVHLFEDIEIVHHLKPTRKSYGKAKKVTFRQKSVSDSDSETAVRPQDASSDEDDLADLSFQVPDIKEKRIRKRKNTKKLMSKKEEKEAEAWAAGFNSMCEDIEEFPLVVE